MLIITGSDDNYVPGVLVLIASAAFHSPSGRFAVLDMGITAPNRARIDGLAERLGIEITRIVVPEGAFDHLNLARRNLTRSTYLRLLIPTLFPDEDRVIYMDCDMVVADDLSELQRVPLGNSVIAAVPCPSPDQTELGATGHAKGTYINAGLLVMNLPVWRQDNIAERCIELLTDPEHPLLSEDQSAINIVAQGRMILLPSRYNTYSDPSSYARLDELPEKPAVIHYVVNNKPWNLSTSLGELWHYHAGRIADLMPPRQTPTLRRRLSLLNRNRKYFIGLLAVSPKYKLRRRVKAEMYRRVDCRPTRTE